MSRRKIFTFKNKRHIPRFLLRIVAWILRIYAWTLRISFKGGEEYFSEKPFSPVVFSMWHNRILFLGCVVPKVFRKRCTVLISNSRDGEYMSVVAREFDVEPVRGSSSKGALHALHGLSNAMDNGISPVITLDGPRGPRYVPHPGAIILAMQHNVPVVPFSINASSYWQMKSWDKMQIPRPFSKVEVIFGQPLGIHAGTPREKALDMLKSAMDAVTKDK